MLKTLGLFIIPACLFAGPPMITNDPFVPNVGQFEINLASEAEFREHTRINTPIIDVNYGLFEKVQLTFSSAYSFTHENDDINGLEIELKWNFYTNEIFSIALDPVYVFYPILSDFDEGEVYELGVPLNFFLSENLNLVVEPRYVDSQNKKAFFEGGAYLQYTSNQHSFFTELFVEENPDKNELYSLVNLGYTNQFYENIMFMFSIGRDVVAEDKQATVSYLGLQFVF